MNSLSLTIEFSRSQLSKAFLGLLLGLAAANAGGETSDPRQVASLTDAQKSHVLSEMRALLAGTQAIISALAEDDMGKVARQARLLGTDMRQKSENCPHDALPEEFLRMGMAVHASFDRMAADAETLKDPKHTLKQLGEAMANCTACHDGYRLQGSRTRRKR